MIKKKVGAVVTCFKVFTNPSHITKSLLSWKNYKKDYDYINIIQCTISTLNMQETQIF